MNPESSANTVTPADYIRPIWRFKWIAILIVLIASGATYAYYNHQPKSYESSTQLYVGQSDIEQLLNGSSANPTTDQRSLANQARLVTTPQVARQVIERLKLDMSTDEVLSHIQVRPDSDADFLTIVATSETARGAADLADAFAELYVKVRSDAATSQAKAQLGVVKQQLARTPRSDDLGRSALKDQILALENAILDPTPVGQQLSPAEIPTSPVAPKPLRNALFAAALGLLLALVLSYVFDSSDKRVRSVEDVEELLDVPILASLPAVDRPVPAHGQRDEMAAELREPSHTLRVNTELLRTKRGAKVLLVASGVAAEGKSTVARNLALAYRDAGMRVGLVEADLRRPTLAALFDLARTPGMAEVLRGTHAVGDVLQVVEHHRPATPNVPASNLSTGHLDVVVAGDGGENPALLFYPVAIRTMLESLASTHDVIVVDSPPVLMVSDALVLAPLVDAVMLVVRAGVATDGSIDRTRRAFDAAPDADILGAVVNGLDAASDYSYYANAYVPRIEPTDEPPAPVDSSDGDPESRDQAAEPARQT